MRLPRREKNFLFLAIPETDYEVMLKPGESHADAEKLAASEPDRYGTGSNGWTTAGFARNETPPDGLMKNWIDESYRLLVPKKRVSQLPE